MHDSRIQSNRVYSSIHLIHFIGYDHLPALNRLTARLLLWRSQVNVYYLFEEEMSGSFRLLLGASKKTKIQILNREFDRKIYLDPKRRNNHNQICECVRYKNENSAQIKRGRGSFWKSSVFGTDASQFLKWVRVMMCSVNTVAMAVAGLLLTWTRGPLYDVITRVWEINLHLSVRLTRGKVYNSIIKENIGYVGVSASERERESSF